jgi:hypothetical protein
LMCLSDPLFTPRYGFGPPHDGVKGRWQINVEDAVASLKHR